MENPFRRRTERGKVRGSALRRAYDFEESAFEAPDPAFSVLGFEPLSLGFESAEPLPVAAGWDESPSRLCPPDVLRLSVR
jgi:hypothetical protein